MVSIQQIKTAGNGANQLVTLAAVTTSAKTDIVWQGYIYVENGETIILNNETASSAVVYLTMVYEPWGGVGAWQEFDQAVAEASSSSSSSSVGYSSSSSSKDSSSSSSSSVGNSSSSSSYIQNWSSSSESV